MERRFTFDSVAELYDATRPGYPDSLIEQVVLTADLRPGDSVLEIGCGTGKATRPFVQRGLRVVALEPGANLLNIARRSLADLPNIEFVGKTFEDWPLEPARFKLIFAAQSFHWIAPEVQFSKAAFALAPGGVLAVFANTVMPLNPPLQEEIERIYARIAPSLIGNEFARTWYLPKGGLAQLFDKPPPPLAAPTHHGYAWSRSCTTETFTDYLSTQSNHQMLPAEQRDALLSEISSVIGARGGVIEVPFQTDLYMAVREA
jgi:ubiquinone/menaquinone biosynthesis C-methylase UbiE